MCARTKISRSLRDIRQRFMTNLDYNITQSTSDFYVPGNNIPFVIKGKQIDRVLTSSLWGYPLNNQDGKYIYNARVENVSSKPFWQPYQNSRVLIPATSFLERDTWFASESNEIIALGGLFMRGTFYNSVVICTTNSVQPEMFSSNPRMPVVLSEDSWNDWLNPECNINNFTFTSEGFIKQDA